MPYIALTKRAEHGRGDVTRAERAEDRIGDLVHRDGTTRSDVQSLVISPRRLQSQQIRPDDIGYMNEITALAAVLEDHRGLAVQHAGGKDRRDTGIWIRERLPLPVDVEVAQGDRRDAVGV